jgi:hypothetical protein
MDPNRDSYRLAAGAGLGIFQAFVPTGAVGILAGGVILLVLGLVAGTISGVWVLPAIALTAGLLLLIPRAIRNEIRREERRNAQQQQRRQASLPNDSDLSEDERRDALRRFRRR